MGIKLHQFEMDKTASRYVFKSGKIAEFIGGFYRTNIDSEIAELKAEIAAGIGSIWTTRGQEVVDSDDIDPVAVYKRKIIAEYEEQKARSLNNGESFSDTSGSGKAASTRVAGVGAAEGAARITAVTPGSIKVAQQANI